MSLNQCNFIGNLTKDPEIKYTSGGMAITEFTIAVNQKYKDQDDTQFIRIKCFDKLAENSKSYLSKGKPVFVSGKYKREEWETEEGKKNRTIIIANIVQFLSQKAESEENIF